MKRFLALLLVCAMVVGLMPSVFATEPEPQPAPLSEEDYITADLMWDAVYAKEAEMETKRAPLSNIIEALITEVTSSPYYAEGTLIRNGEHFFWETVDGIPCGYSPRLAEEGRNAVPLEGYDISTAENVITTSYETKAGYPGAKDVFLIQPYYGLDGDFTEQYVTEANNIAAALKGTATVYRTTEASIDNIADAIESGAVVIFDSHGDTDYASGEDFVSRANSSYICLQTNTGLTSEDYELVTGEFGDYYHAFYGGSYGTMRYYCVDGTAIANHMDSTASNSMLWMAICLGMATDGLHAPLRSMGVEVAYGYSQSVTFQYDYDWEEAFWSKMRLGETVSEAVSYMKKTVGLWDWCHSSSYDTIDEARATYSAFPIVVSSEDVYPGHGNVDDLQNVNSTWALIAPCKHEDITFVPETAETCTEEGNISYYLCTQCNALFRNEDLSERITIDATVLPATGHSYEGQITTNQTCTTDGVMTYTCTVCGHSYTELLPAEGHDYVDGFCTLCGKEKPIATDFTVGESGVFVLAAKVNGNYYAMPNNYTDKSGKLAAIEICGDLGFLEEDFTSDIAIQLTYIPETGKYTIHNGEYYLRYPSSTNIGGIDSPYYWTISRGVNGSWQITSQTSNRGLIYRASGYNNFGGYYRPNVTAGGREYFDLEIIPVVLTTPETAPCSHINTEQTQIAPTCTTEGTLELICKDCGLILNHQILPALGHSWIEGEIVFPPICELEGEQEYTCQFCKLTKIEYIPALGHSWDEGVVTVEPTCSSVGQMTYTCIMCTKTREEELPEKEHPWDEGVVTTEPSCSAVGSMTFTCPVCSTTKEDTIATIPHSYSNGQCINCGSPYTPQPYPFEIGMTGTFVIAANVNGTYYAMGNEFPSTGKIPGTVITPVNGYVMDEDAEGLALELEYDQDSGTYSIFNGTDYLTYISGTDLCTGEVSYGWTLEEGINGTWRVLCGVDQRALIFRDGSYGQFGCYAATNVSAGSKEYFDIEILPIYTYVPGDNVPEWSPPVDETIVINHTLNLASDISINYAVLPSLLEEYDTFMLHCEVPVYDSEEYVGSDTVVIEPVLNGYFYYFTLTGITAVQMGDSIRATLYMSKGEQTYQSKTDIYSVAEYAYGQLNKEGASPALKKLCAELLRYGSCAQLFKNYRTNSLAYDLITEEHMALFTDLETVTFNRNNQILDDLPDPTVTWVGKTLNLESKVIMKFVADLTKFEGDPNDLTLRVSYKNYRGEDTALVLTDPELYIEGTMCYAFDLDSLLAAELRCVVSAAVYYGDTQVSPTVQYSPDSYAVGKTGTLLTLCKAMMSYSDTALAYFTQQ